MSQWSKAGSSPRVLMFSTQYRPIVGGAERQVELQARALRAIGLPITVLTLRRDFRLAMRETDEAGVEIVRIRYDRPLEGVGGARRWGCWRLPLAVLGVASNVRRLSRQSDLFHAHDASTPLTAIAVRTARRCGLPTVVKAANSGEWFDLRQLSSGTPVGPIARRWLLDDVDAWISTSSAVSADLRAADVPSERIANIPNGVVIPNRARDLPQLAKRFLHVGRLARSAPRDIAGMIRAFDAVACRHPEIELAVVGGGDMAAEVKRSVDAAGASSRIWLPGEQAPEKWWAWADCLIQPSFAEGMSNALLEGMAAGLACVAYDIPPNREALEAGTSGLLVPVGDTNALAIAMERLSTEPGFARRLARLARHTAQRRYSIDAIAGAIAHRYELLRAL